MNIPTPRSTFAADENRKALVGETMDALEGLDELPLEEQTRRLTRAQAILAGVLSNDPDVTRPGLPGVEG